MGIFDKMSKELMSGGKAEELRKAANSAEVKKIAGMVDGAALKRAVEAGDNDTINRVLDRVLATEEGKSLAKKVSESFGKK
ncbi:MAG: hypothetical protein LBL15_01570 [Oscillospiraceae bacterium]|jgi:hypothetical protein|nr:hypothetical protein [Oscillospiraceae bacterium]